MQNAIAIFDVGKTNKKLVLFNEDYNIVYEEDTQLPETKDEDGFACEDVYALTEWVKNAFEKVINHPDFNIKAVNFSGYGASFVYINNDNEIASPLYNYLKPYPQDLQNKFYKKYVGESALAKETASPVLGSLNSGMQLYRLKNEKPDLLWRIKFALHLPQYLSFILTQKPATDLTSIGCHTNLWNFNKNTYHKWVINEKIDPYFPAISPCNTVTNFSFKQQNFIGGIGLHDSSAALIPYLYFDKEPFVLISTGTWCISLNPFNHSVLTDYELHQDCLCFFSYEGKRVKASRLFAGYEHEQQVKRLAEYFNKPLNYFTTVNYDSTLIKKASKERLHIADDKNAMVGRTFFNNRNLSEFKNYEQAYHQLISDIMQQQIQSLKLVLQSSTKKIYVDGGFSKNPIFMSLLAKAFPKKEVYAAKVSHASALGAALIIHQHWNKKSVSGNLVSLNQYK